MTRPAVLWACLLIQPLSGPTVAQVAVDVRARATLSDLTWSIDDATVTLRGTLRDDLGRPVPHARVQTAGATASTDREGHFHLDRPAPSTSQRLVVRFAGSALLGPAETTAQVDVGQRALELSVDLPTRLPAGRPLTVTVRAQGVGGEPEGGLPLRWWLDEAGPEFGRLDRRGQAVIALPGLSPGAHRLRVLVDGDARRASAEATRGFEAASPLGVRLTADVVDGAAAALVMGQVAPGPDGGVSVTLIADGHPVARLRADPSGAFERQLSADALGAGRHTIRAMVHTARSGWLDAASEPVTFELQTPSDTPPLWAWSAAGLGALTLLALGVQLSRRPRPAIRPATPPRRPPPLSFDDAPPAKQPRGLHICIRDGLDEAPLTGWLVALGTDHDPPPRGTTQPPGGPLRRCPVEGLTLPEVPRRLWVHADGYVARAVPFDRPGRAIVRLLPARAAVQALFDAVLNRAGQPPLAFGRQTPRDASPPLVARGAAPADVSALAGLVEVACFGESPPSEAQLVRIYALAQRVEDALGDPIAKAER